MKPYLIITLVLTLAILSLRMIPSTISPTIKNTMISAAIFTKEKPNKTQPSVNKIKQNPKLAQKKPQNTPITKAAELIANEDRKNSESYLHELVSTNPDGSTKLKALALLNIYQQFDQQRDANTSYLWTLFAKKLGEFGEYNAAISLSTKATQQDENYRDAWIIKGYSEMKSKLLSASEQSLLKAYKIDPSNSQIQYLLGIVYFKQNKPDLSTQYLLYAKENDTIHQQNILEKLAENAIAMENYPLASYYFEESLQNSKNQAPLFSRLIWLNQEKLNQPKKALKYAEQRIIYAPQDPESYQLISWVLTKQDRLDEALRYLEKSDLIK